MLTFNIHINDLTLINSWVHDIVAMAAGAAGGIHAGIAAGWLAQYRREVLAITLNFRGRAAEWWSRIRESNLPTFCTPYSWNDDTYTHPDNAAAGIMQYPGLRTMLVGYFVDAVLRSQPNYRGLDLSAVKFSGRSKEIHSLIQTVRAIATQNNLP